MTLIEISNEQIANVFYTSAKIGTIGGAMSSLACAILGQDYTYPCTVTALAGCTWFSIWLAQSAQQKAANNNPENSPNPNLASKYTNSLIDALGVRAKGYLEGLAGKAVDMSVGVSKTAIVASLPLSLGTSAASVLGGSLRVVGDGAKSLSTTGINYSVDSMGKKIKGSLD